MVLRWEELISEQVRQGGSTSLLRRLPADVRKPARSQSAKLAWNNEWKTLRRVEYIRKIKCLFKNTPQTHIISKGTLNEPASCFALHISNAVWDVSHSSGSLKCWGVTSSCFQCWAAPASAKAEGWTLPQLPAGLTASRTRKPPLGLQGGERVQAACTFPYLVKEVR